MDMNFNSDHNHVDVHDQYPPQYRQHNQRRHLVQRANRLIEQYNLPVPRFFSTRFLNFEFWCLVFSRIFEIKCDLSLRTPSERTDMIQSRLNTLATMIQEDLGHIQANRLLNSDVPTMSDLLQIAEIWQNEANEANQCRAQTDCIDKAVAKPIFREKLNVIHSNNNDRLSSGSSNRPDVESSTMCEELADKLYRALKNQILAIEIEKKLKIYFGDVTARQANNPNMRASRQSIVRTRAIQHDSMFDYGLHRIPKRNHVLSVELANLFPEISKEFISKIMQQEQSLLMMQKNVKNWYENLALNQVGRAVNDVITQQKRRIDSVLKEANEKNATQKAKNERAEKIAIQSLQREKRAQKASLHQEIETFFRESTASYKSARAQLERILVLEFRKVDANKRQQINEIRDYLKHHYEAETDKLRCLLQNYDMM